MGLELGKILISRRNFAKDLNHYRVELVTVLCSGLRYLITSDLVLQLNILKIHLRIESFAKF
ncbi:hypothetical protein A2955_00560 [Candidatus Woesebacteria bacterium RIFCSPLOWO2_01_FULL_37_19]|uniref:Uncharacterized protein n=1 Tax=Candidatus Woesebacteria bacterium RIFCSPLOWO2_01_FULL_37_19 TaxID=1802514 RepID=A0A1F8B729_9BACT|nr:MAG: hypothetical protein A2955_00560 [Candidatus Woesebacteria bacterium RIFCSPLOWO2_01_FULL_37_19]